MIGPVRSLIGPAALALALTLGVWAAAVAAPAHSVAIRTGAQVTQTGSVVMMQSNGGENGTFQCLCNKGRGNCTVTRMPSSMICDNPGGSGACTGECVFFTTTTGVAGAAARASSVRSAAPMTRRP